MRMGYAPVVGVIPHKPDVELTTIMMFVQVPRFNLLQGQPSSCIPIISRFFIYGIQMVPRSGGDRYVRGTAAPVVDTGDFTVYRQKLCEKDAGFMSGWWGSEVQDGCVPIGHRDLFYPVAFERVPPDHSFSAIEFVCQIHVGDMSIARMPDTRNGWMLDNVIEADPGVPHYAYAGRVDPGTGIKHDDGYSPELVLISDYYLQQLHPANRKIIVVRDQLLKTLYVSQLEQFTLSALPADESKSSESTSRRSSTRSSRQSGSTTVTVSSSSSRPRPMYVCDAFPSAVV